MVQLVLIYRAAPDFGIWMEKEIIGKLLIAITFGWSELLTIIDESSIAKPLQ